jgi:4-amino-4-deoxy-L-arabinose transferase-like glycosyltransferase
MTTIWRGRSVLPLILLLSVLLRVGVALYLGNDLSDWRGGTADQISYDALAQRVVAGHGFSFGEAWWPATAAGEPTAHWSYLYTGWLALVYAVFGHQPLVARLIQALVTGVLLPWLVWRIGRFSTPHASLPLLAALLVALYPYYILFSAALMTEAFYTVALLWLVDLALRIARDPAPAWRNGIEAGLAIGATLLLRQVGLFFVAIIVVWLLWQGWRTPAIRRSLPGLAAWAALVAALCLLPAIVRNQRAFDVLSFWPNTNSGFALYWANHPIYGTRFETVLSDQHGVSYQELIPPELRHLNEMQLDQALREAGVALILDDLPRFVRLSLSRIPVHFQFWPTADSPLSSNLLRLVGFGLALPFMLLGIGRFFWQALRPAPDRLAPAAGWLLLLLFAGYNGLHILTWAKVRYRLPTDALLLLFAALALVWLWKVRDNR